MTPERINQMLALIDEIVGDDSMPYREKRDLILAEASDHQKTHLEEFSSWFDMEDE